MEFMERWEKFSRVFPPVLSRRLEKNDFSVVRTLGHERMRNFFLIQFVNGYLGHSSAA